LITTRQFNETYLRGDILEVGLMKIGLSCGPMHGLVNFGSKIPTYPLPFDVIEHVLVSMYFRCIPILGVIEIVAAGTSGDVKLRN
jgi:hypothetical protein